MVKTAIGAPVCKQGGARTPLHVSARALGAADGASLALPAGRHLPLLLLLSCLMAALAALAGSYTSSLTRVLDLPWMS